MACVFNTLAHFDDVNTVKKHLFPIDHSSDTDDDDLSEENWAWPDDNTTQKSKVDEKTVSWLNDCKISLSSTAKLLVIAHETSMVILTSKWNFQEEGDVKSKYHITWRGNPCMSQDEQITSVLCLPLLSQGKSSHYGTDWTCIVVGFSTGYVRFYTENCSLLITEMLHNEKVLYLKCQSYQPPSSSTGREPTEELYVIYSSAVCIVPGFGLFQTLRACRNQLARVQANCGEKVPAPPLVFKKLGFQDQSVMTDSEVAGPATANTFDHLLTASVCGGFNAWYRSSAPQTSLVVAAGKKPYVAFHYALEGGAPPVLADVAKVMANKLKSAIGQAVPSWLLGGRKSQLPDRSMEIATEPPERMSCRFGLCDSWRAGCQIVLAPHRVLCVVCDTLGRVILIDTLRGVAVRMWKGYRDAQCGWLEVKEDSPQRSNIAQQKVALFLVIYSPKKGIIEVWTMQQGPRIATFPVSKNGRLVYINYGLMGLNNTYLKGGNKCQSPCVFIDPSGTISEIVVPFHFALSAKSSKRVRDLHLLKKLKAFIKEQEFDNNSLCTEVRKMVEDLRTVEIRIQTLEALSCNKAITPEAMQSALQAVAQVPPSSQDEPGGKTLASLTTNLRCLVSFYSRLHALNEQPPSYDSTVSEELLPEMLTTHLSTPPEERTRLLNLFNTLELLVEKQKPTSAPRVTFADSGNRGALVEFLSCFELGGTTILVKSGTNVDKLTQVGRIILEGALGGADMDEWSAAVCSSCVEPMDLVQLVVCYWLSYFRPISLQQNIADMLRLEKVIKLMCQVAGKEVVLAANNQVSPWWQEVRNALTCSTNPWGALTAAVVCRSVALSFEREGVGADDQCDWEHVSFDTCQWGILIARLEDVAVLAAVIAKHLEYESHGTNEKTDVSLETMLARGKGAVTELAAGWLATWVQEPSVLSEAQSQEEENKQVPAEKGGIKEGLKLPHEEGSDAVKLSCSSTDASLVLNAMKVSILRQHFPYSMGYSVLLANLCWEHMVAWSRSVSDVSRLEKAVSCLESIPSPQLKRGLCCLIWSMHLRPPLEASAMLIQRVGRTPKERLCRQEVGFSDTAMAPFLHHCLAFLNIFLEVCCSQEVSKSPTMRMCEELWDGGPTGPPPLAELALSQLEVNYDLVHLHYQVVLMLHMLVSFNLKLTRPLAALLDAEGQAALFTDLSGRPHLPSHNPDAPLVTARTNFLCRVVSAGVQTVQVTDAESEVLDASRAVHWLSHCLTLGSGWFVSNDTLRRHLICELYSNGYDRLAEEMTPAVSDKSLLASQLLLIVGQRMKHVINTSPNLCGVLSKVSPALSHWLQTMPEDQLKNMNCNLKDMASMLIPIMQYLSEEHQEYELALSMVDAVHAFQDADISTK